MFTKARLFRSHDRGELRQLGGSAASAGVCYGRAGRDECPCWRRANPEDHLVQNDIDGLDAIRTDTATYLGRSGTVSDQA